MLPIKIKHKEKKEAREFIKKYLLESTYIPIHHIMKNQLIQSKYLHKLATELSS